MIFWKLPAATKRCLVDSDEEVPVLIDGHVASLPRVDKTNLKKLLPKYYTVLYIEQKLNAPWLS